MFEELSDKLEGIIRKLSGKSILDNESIDEAMREIRRVLLEADVNYKLVGEFLARVKEKAVGRKVIKSVSPGQMMVKIVYDELVELLGGSSRELVKSPSSQTVIMLCGLQGSGKTTTASKLAKRLKADGRKPMMIAADVYRPAAIDQLQTLGKDLDVPVYTEGHEQKNVPAIIKNGLADARSKGADTVLIDTAGRLHIDQQMMDELSEVKKTANPHEILLVVDGMTGQDAVSIAETFNEQLAVTGLIMTKLDGDARGGAALSIYGVTQIPIKFIGVGEQADALEVFHPDRMASRLLQMGDIVSLVERAEERMDQEEAEKLEKKISRNKDMDLEDFLSTLKQLQRLGSMESLLSMIPGVSSKMVKAANMDPKKFGRIEAVILSMTPEERQKPNVINASRRKRIADGCGQTIQDVNQLLRQFDQMRKMMKKMGLFSAGGAGRSAAIRNNMSMFR